MVMKEFQMKQLKMFSNVKLNDEFLLNEINEILKKFYETNFFKNIRKIFEIIFLN